MNNLNFIVGAMTALRYFVPLVIEGKKRNLECFFYLGKDNGKYNSVRRSDNLNYLISLAKILGVHLRDHSDVRNSSGPVFQIEAECKWEGKNKNNGKKIAITYMADYAMGGTYLKCLKDVDHVLFPSKELAKAYGCLSEKNIYFGSPKYDIEIGNREHICQKYGIDSSKKFALYAFPKTRDNSKVNTHLITSEVKKRGYQIICKSRAKDVIPDCEKKYFDKIFYDASWYPHTTMELLSISDFLINFESTTSKEAILLKKPIIDFKVKPKTNSTGERIATFKFLYGYEFFRNISEKDINQKTISKSIDFIVNKDNNKLIDDSLNDCIRKYFFEVKNTCSKIIDFALGVNF